MTDEAPVGADAGPARPEDAYVTLGDDIATLVAEVKRATAAEAAFQGKRAALAGIAVGKIAVFVGLALVLLFFVLMALVFGLVLGLASVVGPWAATGIVVGVLLLATVLALLGAWAGWKRLRWALRAQGDSQ